ncbi:MAG TPA: exodeoxyribonuclease VII small subunit [Anaerolineae bacterium]
MSTEPRPFEEIYGELEETVRRLESGDLTLAESLALFERATALAEQANGLLDQAELRVRQLIAQPDGSLASQDFDGWQAGR